MGILSQAKDPNRHTLHFIKQAQHQHQPHSARAASSAQDTTTPLPRPSKRHLQSAHLVSFADDQARLTGTAAARALHPQLLHRAAQTSSLMAEEVACSIVTMRIHRLEMPGSE